MAISTVDPTAASNTLSIHQGAGGFGVGGGQIGSFFGSLTRGGSAGANIQRPTVAAPNRSEFGTPGAAPVIQGPNRSDYGLSPTDQAATQAGIATTAATAEEARKGFNDPTSTGAFKNIMGLAQEQTGEAAQEAQRHASDVAQRRGYAGGFEDTARATGQQRMQALAQAGFAGAQAVQEQEGAQYGRAVGAFVQLQDSYNQAQVTGNTSYAHDLTNTHIANAENALKTMELYQNQLLAFASSIQQAKQLQAQLNEQFNKDLIDNNRFISMNKEIAASLAATMMGLQEKGREFDVGAKQFEETRSDRELANQRALRAAGKDVYGGPIQGSGGTFTGLA